MDDLKTMRFALIVCFVCSLILATAYTFLDPIYKANQKDELRTLVLKVCGEKTKGLSQSKIKNIFSKKVNPIIIDYDGNLTKQQDVFKLTESQLFKEKDGRKQYYPIYVYTSDKGNKKYVIQMSGKGLWSTIKALVAIKSDLETIDGFEIIGQGETPGLGGDIEKPNFCNEFKGKKLFKDGYVLNFKVVKGEADGVSQVDGLSGATMTGKGLTKLINKDSAVYNKFFSKLRSLSKGK